MSRPPLQQEATPAPPPALPAIPQDTSCVLRSHVARHDVTWALRTRLDATPSMIVLEGEVTAWLIDSPDAKRATGIPAMAVAEIENGAMQIRALVGPEELDVVMTRPTLVMSTIPDGYTSRRVYGVEDGKATLNVKISGTGGFDTDLPCESLGLERNRRFGTGSLLPPRRGSTVVRASAVVTVDGRDLPASGFDQPVGAAVPSGLAADILGDDTESGRRTVSIETCGGVVVGTVSRRDLLGPPTVMRGSESSHCPNTGNNYRLPEPRLTPLVACAREIPVFVRTLTFEDPAGVIKAGARFRRDGEAVRGTERVTVVGPPVEPIGSGQFVVKTSDLVSCAPVDRGGGG